MSQPPSTGEWGALLARPVKPVVTIVRTDLPPDPGVYLWRRDGVVVYVGRATRLQSRLWTSHLGGGVSLANSSLRRNVCEQLFGIEARVTGGKGAVKVTPAQAADVKAWLQGCELSWQATDTVGQAIALEDRLRKSWLPPLNKN